MKPNRFNFRVWDKENKCFSVNETNYELMQSTGLVDRNGKEMFEGDIIKITLDDGKPYSRTYVEKVTWDDKNYCFLFGGERINCLLYAFSETTMEVIGNIYENKELLRNSMD